MAFPLCREYVYTHHDFLRCHQVAQDSPPLALSSTSIGSEICDKCDGKHPTNQCPWFKKARLILHTCYRLARLPVTPPDQLANGLYFSRVVYPQCSNQSALLLHHNILAACPLSW